jgi:LPXTG-motif cell wall-anchored protein
MTTTNPGPPILPATGLSDHRKYLPIAMLLVSCGALLAVTKRRSEFS